MSARRTPVVFVGLTLALGALVPATADARRLVVERNTLTFTRADGTAIAFGHHLRLACRSAEGSRHTPVVSVIGGPATVRTVASYWRVDVAPRDVASRPLVRFPATLDEGGFGSPHVFAYDRLRTGEYSSSAENASGSMRITRATCARTMRLSFTIAAGLDTEVGDGPPLRVRGAFSARAS